MKKMKRFISSVLIGIMAISSLAMPVNAAQVGATENVSANALTTEIGPDSDFTDMSLVTEEWATAHGWEATSGVYRKTINNVGYELFYGWAPGEDYNTLDPHWQITVIESPNAIGKIEILNNVDGFPVFSIANRAFAGGDMTEVVIPEGIEYIGTAAFNLCKYLESVTLPNTLKTISSNAFKSTSLTEVTIPASVISIGNYGVGSSHNQIITFEGNAPEITEFTFLDDVTIYVQPNATGFDVEPWTTLNIQVLRTSYELIPENSQIHVGKTTQINYEVNADMIDKLTWTSSNEDVATVDENGVVTAVGAGKATITLTDANGITGSCEIEVIVPVEEIKIDYTEIPMRNHEKMDVIVTIMPEDADVRNLTWSSSDEEVAVVDEYGTITAVGVGTATITVSCDGEGASVEVIVEPVEITSFEIVEKELFLDTGKTSAITTVIEPEDADATDLVWKSTDETIATVDRKGNVTGIGIGTTTITASYKDMTASVEVTVTEPEIKELPYTDVSEADWYFDTVYDVYKKGLMTGLNATTFGPVQILARGQFATILYRMENSPVVAYTEKFPDVADGQFYTSPVLWANQNGIVSGYANGYFGPADAITREQMAVMMYRYANYKGYDISNKADITTYPDANNVSDWATDAMKWCVAKGIITGDSGNLNPQGQVSRAVAATIISRYIEAYK